MWYKIINKCKSRNAIYRYSIENNDKFWETLAKSRLDWRGEFSSINTSSFEEGRLEWFKGGKINVADNCITRHLAERGHQNALIWEKQRVQLFKMGT